MRLLIFVFLFFLTFIVDAQIWSSLGPYQIPIHITTKAKEGTGRVDCIAFHPTDFNTIYIGSPTGGFWKTTDNAQTWYTTTDYLPAIGIADIIIDSQNPDIIYIATGDKDTHRLPSVGIFKSDDGGESWNQTEFKFDIAEQVFIHGLRMHPANINIQWVVTNVGIYRTTDAWSTFEKVIDGNFKDIEINPKNPEIVYVSTIQKDGNSTIYKSIDGGSVFKISTNGFIKRENIARIDIEVTQANPDLVIATCVNKLGNLGAIYKSTDAAENWVQLISNSPNLLGSSCLGQDSEGKGLTKFAVSISPVNENEIHVAGIHHWKSINGGVSWRPVTGWCGDTKWLHRGHHYLCFSPENILFTGNDGGVYRSPKADANWENISSNLQIMPVNQIGTSMSDTIICLSTEEVGGLMLKNNTWLFLTLGTSGACNIVNNNSNILFISNINNQLLKSENGGLSFKDVTPDGAFTEIKNFNVIKHPVKKTLYACYNEIYKTDNNGETWISISDFGSDAVSGIIDLEIAKSNPNIFYAIDKKNLWKSKRFGENWKKISLEIHKNAEISDLAVSSSDPNKIWVSIKSFNTTSKIIYSSDGGNSWLNYSDGLPNLPVNCIVYESKTNHALYAGTDQGVYYRNKQMAEWQKLSDGLPNVIISDLEIDYSLGKIRAATFGRGLWELALYKPISNSSYADYVAKQLISCGGSSIDFMSTSKGEITSYLWNFGEDAEPATANTKGPHSVIYSTKGEKTISLTINGIDTETKVEYISVLSEIEVNVYPEKICSKEPVILSASGAENYIWTPKNGLNSNTGAIVTANPDVRTFYNVKGIMGNCESETQVEVNVISDDICSAVELKIGENGPFTNECATIQDGEPIPNTGSEGIGCNTQDGWCAREGLNNSVWFKFVPDESGIISIDTYGNFNNQIAVFEAESCNDITNRNYKILAANDNYHSVEENSTAAIYELQNLVENKTYWLMVDGAKNGESGIFSINLQNQALTSVNETIKSEQLNVVEIYPNPNSGKFNLILHQKPTSQFVIEVLNLNGKIIYRNSRANEQSTEIDIRNQAEGMYLLRVIYDSYCTYKKVVIKK